jgi:putative membrane protein
MDRFAIVAVAAALAAPLTAAAQATNPAGAAPDTPRIATGHPTAFRANDADKLFVMQISLGGMAEVDMGKLAGQRGSNADVKAFAQRMVSDHDTANSKLAGVAKASGTPLRTDWDTDHSVARSQLEKTRGTAFDVAYIRAQIEEHQKTAQLLEWEIGSGEDPAIRHYAMSVLPTVLDHLEMAQGLLAQLTSTSTKLE